MSEQPMWPCPEIVSRPPYVMNLKEACIDSAVEAPVHPHQPGSLYCYEHMPKAELESRVQDHLQHDKRYQRLLERVEAAQAVAKRVSAGGGSGGLANLTKERRNGAQVRYPLGGEQWSEPVPTIYTPKSCYPYPNHRRRLKLAGSYATSECQVLDVGWLPGQKPQK